MADAASGCADVAEVQVAYEVGVEVFVDPRAGKVRRVVIIDEAVRLDEEKGARQAGTLAAIPKAVAQRATRIAESCGWPGWEQGF